MAGFRMVVWKLDKMSVKSVWKVRISGVLYSDGYCITDIETDRRLMNHSGLSKKQTGYHSDSDSSKCKEKQGECYILSLEGDYF